MTISIVSSGAIKSVGNPVVPRPPLSLPGDLVVCFYAGRGVTNVDPPVGFVEIVEKDTVSGSTENVTASMFYRFIEVDDPTDDFAAWSGLTDPDRAYGMGFVALRGVDPDDPVVDFATTEGLSDSVTVPALSGLTSGQVIIGAACCIGDYLPDPSGVIADWTFLSAAGGSISGNGWHYIATGSSEGDWTSNITTGFTTTNAWATISAAFRSAVLVPGVPAPLTLADLTSLLIPMFEETPPPPVIEGVDYYPGSNITAMYPLALDAFWFGLIDPTDGTLSAIVVDGSVLFDPTHEFLDDLNEDGFIESPVVFTGVSTTMSRSGPASFVRFDADDIIIDSTPMDRIAKALVVFVDSGTPSTSRLIAYLGRRTNTAQVAVSTETGVIWSFPLGVFVV